MWRRRVEQRDANLCRYGAIIESTMNEVAFGRYEFYIVLLLFFLNIIFIQDSLISSADFMKSWINITFVYIKSDMQYMNVDKNSSR